MHPPLTSPFPPPRVALFTGNYNHIADGVSRTLNRLVAHLEAQGVPVLVFGPTVEAAPVAHAGELVPVPSVPAPGRPEYRVSVRFPRTAQARLEAFGPTLVHIATPDLLGLRALRWAVRRGVPVVSSYHTHFASYLRYYRLQALEPALWAYMRWFYGHCRHLYVPSLSMAEVLQEKGITAGVRLWERGVEAERFHPRHRDEAWRREIGLAEGEAAVAFVSRLVWEKGLDVYLEVMQRLAREGRPARALVVGDGPARAELQERLPPSAVLTGFLEGEALARAYASADVFLFPSDTETFGNVTLEAMASGLPAVCADATGAHDLVVPGKTGFLAPPRQPDAFFPPIDALVGDAALRASMGRAARHRAEQYAWPALLDRMVGYYHEALAA